MAGPDWRDVLAAEELAPGELRTVQVDGRGLLLRRARDGRLTAIDNRCPHEGYPLSQGEVRDGLLTCAWHNWKFRLRDGHCVIGGEDVVCHAVEERAGRIRVDASGPPAAAARVKVHAGLERAFQEDDWAHAARELERLEVLGAGAEERLGLGCDWAARHARYGFDHGLAAAADYAALLRALPEHDSVILLEAMHGLVHPHVRRGERSFAAPETLATTPDESGYRPLGLRLRRHIEDEALAPAQALLRGALGDAVPLPVVLAWLAAAATDHFLDFGHAHIYVVKADELLQAIGPAHAHPVLTSLVTRLVHGTREDTLPYMRPWRTWFAGVRDRLTTWTAAAPDPCVTVDVDAFIGAVLGPSLEPALEAVRDALDAGLAPARIASLLALAAARRLLCFDATIAEREDVSEGWLHVTHLLTHADAVRESLLRWPSAETLRGLFHSARFIQHTHVLAGPEPDPETLPAGDRGAFERAMLEGCVWTPLTRAIFVQHHVKTVLAARRVARALAEEPLVGAGPLADTPWRGVRRFLAHPHRERRLRDAARVARGFVQEGRMRGNLLGY